MMRDLGFLQASRGDITDLLRKFENNLINQKLDSEKLKVFFSTLWAFYKETPSGILSLSLRLGDEWMLIDEWGATAQLALILSADCDEFGVGDGPGLIKKTHHQLFLQSAQHFNIDRGALVAQENILSSGKLMGELSYEYYRRQSVGAGLGFHLASEYTSFLEFSAFLNGFMEHKDYYSLSENENPVVQFFKIHTVVEPMHQSLSEKVIENYVEKKPDSVQEIRRGMEAYFAAYNQLFCEFNSRLFNA